MSHESEVKRLLARVGATVLERGWLSSNNIVFADGPSGAAVVDTGYAAHSGQTLSLVDATLGGKPLRRIINTHLHSDHCGGNAALWERWRCQVIVPAPSREAVALWDVTRLTYAYTGQSCPRFPVHRGLSSGEVIELGGVDWRVVQAPGHDPDAVMLFQPDDKILIAGDALWQARLAIVFPELAGERGFEEVESCLRCIAELAPRVVVPGHGPAFMDVEGALAASRAQLARFRSEPAAHHRHAARALLMFHMLEMRSCAREEALAWLCETPVFGQIWQRLGASGTSLKTFAVDVVDQLVRTGTLGWSACGQLQVRLG